MFFFRSLDSDFAFCHLSSCGHMRRMGGGDDGGVFQFKVEEGCQFQVFEQHAMWENPSPSINFNFMSFQNAPDTARCFIMAKVHEVSDFEPATATCSQRLIVGLMDLQGNLRKATVWPPLCYLDCWCFNKVVTIMECTANLKYNSWSVGSDCCVEIDATPRDHFSSEVASTVWEAQSLLPVPVVQNCGVRM